MTPPPDFAKAREALRFFDRESITPSTDEAMKDRIRYTLDAAEAEIDALGLACADVVALRQQVESLTADKERLTATVRWALDTTDGVTSDWWRSEVTARAALSEEPRP